jgi:regulation of enolase protein 1 (concanavalin A-like superfamily)
VDHLTKNGWRWLNEPAQWTGDTITADPETDFWRTTHYGYVHENAHILGTDRTGDFELTVTFAADYQALYDQAGIGLWIDERNWIKSGIEFVEDRQLLSAVVTRDVSDWSVIPLAEPAEKVTVKAAREGDAVTIHYGLNGSPPAEMLRLAYFPPGLSVLAGVMCASPTGKGFATRFEDITIQP